MWGSVFHISIFQIKCHNEFLGYLQEWKGSVDGQSGFTEAEKAMTCLSKETIEGLHMTGNYRPLLTLTQRKAISSQCSEIVCGCHLHCQASVGSIS